MRTLDRRQTSGPADDEGVLRDVERCSPTSALGVGWPGQIREVEPVRDHDDLLRRGHSQTEKIVTYLLAHGHDRSRLPCEHALELDEHVLAPGVEVARENVPVERVDGCSGPAAAGQPGRDPPGGSGLCRVGMEDVCLASHHSASEFAHRA